MNKIMLLIGISIFMGAILLILACGLGISWLKTVASGLLGFCGGYVIGHAKHCVK